MKNLMLSVAFMAITINGSLAQNTSFGITAGASIPTLLFSEEGSSSTTNSFAGFTIGALANVPINNRWSFQPALNFVQQGGQESEEFFGSTFSYKIRINQVELPMNVLFNAPGNNGHFFVGAGPALAFAVSGKVKVSEDGESETEKINFGSGEEDDMKSMNFSANFLAGYQLAKAIFFALNYNLGLSNLSNDPESKLKTRYFGVRIGYMFGSARSGK